MNSHQSGSIDVLRAAAEAPMLDAEMERAYLKRFQEHGDARALQALLVSHLRLVVSVARKYASSRVPVEDLVAEGNLGLVEAARRFDLARGNRFATYASWWVRALVRRYAIANRRIVGTPSTRNARRLLGRMRQTERQLSQHLGAAPTPEQVAEALDVSAQDVRMMDAALRGRDMVLGDADDGGRPFELADEAASPEERVEAEEAAAHTAASVRKALTVLDRRERLIVERRLLAEDRYTLAGLGSAMGLSRERVRQLEKRACDKLREALYEQVA